MEELLKALLETDVDADGFHVVNETLRINTARVMERPAPFMPDREVDGLRYMVGDEGPYKGTFQYVIENHLHTK